MMNDPQKMIAAYFEGKLNAAQVAELEAYLRKDRQRARAFIRQAMLDTHLSELLHEQNVQDVAVDLSDDSQFGTMLKALDAPEGSVEPVRVSETNKRSKPTSTEDDAGSLSAHNLAAVGGYALRLALTSRPAKKLYAWAAIAAAIALALVLINPWADHENPTDTPLASDHSHMPEESAQPIPRDHPGSTPVATLTAQHNAQWAERALARGSELHPNQRLTLTAGFAEITTNDGAVAIIEAPATIELTDSDNALHLHAGKLVGLCHTDSSKGFVVRTKHADITDLGTEFAVQARTDGVDTTVFVGDVTLTTPDGATQPITTNQTARLSIQDGQRMIALEDKPAEGFARRLPRPALITDASINLDGYTVEVVPNGVYEDASIRTDRDHQLNGVDADGLPAILLGGDLVRTPGNPKDNTLDSITLDSIRVEIELSRLADVYLLINAKTSAPDWLTRDYRRTALRAGKDLGPSAGGNQLGVGPGDSIDQVLVAWVRKQPAQGRLLVAQSLPEKGSYTIIAVPRDRGAADSLPPLTQE